VIATPPTSLSGTTSFVSAVNIYLHPRLRSFSRKVCLAVSRVGGWCCAQPDSPLLVSKLHILRMSVDTVPVATNHGGTARQCNPLDLLAYPSYMMLQYAPVRVAGHVLADISNINTSGRGPWRPGAGVVGAGWVAPLPPVPFFLWYIGTVGAAHCVPNAESHQLLCRLAARHCRSPPATLGKSLRLVKCQGGKARSHLSLSYSP
jgi:hypothetical protein